MASAVPASLRRWQREATIETDASGPATMGEKAVSVQGVIGESVWQSIRAPIIHNDPNRVMASWDNDDTLRIHLAGLNGGFAIIRQSNLFSGKDTPGAATADGCHTDMTPVPIELRVRHEA